MGTVKDKLKKVKSDLDTGVNAIKTNKKIKLDNKELKKRLDADNKEKEEEIISLRDAENTQKGNNSEYHARVKLFITSGSKREQIADLGAYFGHKEGKQTLRVLNKDKEIIFEEIKPDWQNSFNYSDEKTLKEKIKSLEKILQQFQNNEIQEKKDKDTKMVYYEEDYLAMLRKAKQSYAIKVLGSDGTYSETVNGLEEYKFDIIGFFKIPMYYYTDKAIMGIPPASKIIAGQYLLDVLFKDYKADETKAERIVMTIGMITALILVIASIWILTKNMSAFADWSANLMEITKNLVSLTNYTTGLENIADGINKTNELLSSQIEIPVQDLNEIIR